VAVAVAGTQENQYAVLSGARQDYRGRHRFHQLVLV